MAPRIARVVVRAHRHAGRVLRGGDGVDDCWTTQEEWTMTPLERIARAVITACLACFVLMLLWGLL